MSYDGLMLDFCDRLEKKILDSKRWVDVKLKRLNGRPSWVYLVVLEAWNGQQEAYEVDVIDHEWIKVYGA